MASGINPNSAQIQALAFGKVMREYVDQKTYWTVIEEIRVYNKNANMMGLLDGASANEIEKAEDEALSQVVAKILELNPKIVWEEYSIAQQTHSLLAFILMKEQQILNRSGQIDLLDDIRTIMLVLQNNGYFDVVASSVPSENSSEEAFELGMTAASEGDYAEAFKYWMPLAMGGLAKAQCNIGTIYSEGHGVDQDADEAFKWLNLAASQGHAGAQTNLGALYANGELVQQDIGEAKRLFRLAADQGLLLAQALLDDMDD